MKSHNDLATHLERVFIAQPQALAVESHGTQFDWQSLQRLTHALRARFDGLGLGDGAAIGVLARNQFGSVAALAAVLGTGRCFVTLNPMQPPAKLAKDLRALRLPVVIGAVADLEHPEMQAALTEVGTVQLRLEGPSGSHLMPPAPGATPPVEHHQSLPGTALLMLSSGTTGEPKRIPLRYVGLLAAVSDQLPRDHAQQPIEVKGSAALLSNPMVHIGGLFFFLKTLIDARPLVLLDRFDVEQWVGAIERHQIRTGSLMPAAIRMICDADVPRQRLASRRSVTTGASPLSPELQQRFEDTYNCPVLIIYGATEFAGAVAGWTVPMHRQFIDSKRGSVGRAMPGCDLRTVDEVTGETLPPGDVGLLEVRTVQIGRDGWLRTTDLAVIDEDGFVWLKGRADGAINRGGFKILPEEIVQALKEHPDVADAAVVGLSDERLGQVPVAAVELRAGASLTEPALMEFARANLTRYHVPVAIRIVESLPRSAAMKPILPEVRALFGAP